MTELDPSDFEGALNRALSSPIKLTFESHARAVQWRLRANAFRASARKASEAAAFSEDPMERLGAGTTPWDTLELRIPKGSAEVHIVHKGAQTPIKVEALT